MLGWVKRMFGSTPTVLSAEQKAALDQSGASNVLSEGKSSAIREVTGKEKGLFCKKRHPLNHGQREEDCFDCYLLDVLGQERAGLPQEAVDPQVVGTMICLNGFHRGGSFPIILGEDQPLIVGADPDCDLILSDERISRRHISMVRRQGRTIVRDLNSLHHSAMRAEGELQWYVLDPDREYWFRDGCHIMLGDIEFLFRATDEQSKKISAAAG